MQVRQERFSRIITTVVWLSLVGVPCSGQTISGLTYIGQYQGHTYYRSEAITDWNLARQDSELAGGHLVTISSQGENDFLLNVAGVSEHAMWIGLYKDGDGVWCWVTGEPLSFSNWNTGEPNGIGGDLQAGVLYCKKGQGSDDIFGRWNDTPPAWTPAWPYDGLFRYLLEFDGPPPANPGLVFVNGTSNVFGAGQNYLPGNTGTTPPCTSLPAGQNRTLNFSVSGWYSYGPSGHPEIGGDGLFCNCPWYVNGIDFNPQGGISGIKVYPDPVAFLLGVFLSDDAPAPPAPPRLEFIAGSILEIGFTSLAPAIAQLFFLGDGLTGTGSGTQQEFVVPDAATRVCFGFADGYEFRGDPWSFDDNHGELAVSMERSHSGLTGLGPAKVWVGLKNSDDQGTQFDLRVELYKNLTTLLSTGETLCTTGVTRNPNLAKQVEVQFGPIAEESLSPGDQLSIRVRARIGTNPDGTKCSGPGGSHNNAGGLRLYYDSANRPSRFFAEAAPLPLGGLFLHTGTTDFLDTVEPTGSTPKYKDSSGLNFAGGNIWKDIGTWSISVP